MAEKQVYEPVFINIRKVELGLKWFPTKEEKLAHIKTLFSRNLISENTYLLLKNKINRGLV